MKGCQHNIPNWKPPPMTTTRIATLALITVASLGTSTARAFEHRYESGSSGSVLVIESNRTGEVEQIVAELRGSNIVVTDQISRQSQSFNNVYVRIKFVGDADRDEFYNLVPDLPCSMFGNEGNDLLYGGNTSDFLYGGPGRDELHGNDGHDTLLPSTSRDEADPVEGIVDGGDGFDTLHTVGFMVYGIDKFRPVPAEQQFDRLSGVDDVVVDFVIDILWDDLLDLIDASN